MSDTVDIGAARIRLIVDSADFDQVIAQGKSAVTGFGNDAQAAYDKTGNATKRAADRLLDYVSSIGRADTSMDKFVRNASRAGVDKPILDASIAAWSKRNAEVEQAAELTQQLASAQKAAFQQDSSVNSFILQLKNLEQAAGKDYYALLELKAAELGVSAQAGPMIASLKAANSAISNGTITAKQYAFAVRGLPAQFTDIFTSLAAGQNPLMVLLQQGGQIKDMFGGVGGAIKAVGAELVKVATNPLVLATAAIATLAVAVYQAESRLTSFQIAAAKGGGRAGSGASLSMLAENLNSLQNISLGNADKSVQALAVDGLLVGKNFQIAAEATARWATVTGESVDTLASSFEAIARDPMAKVLDGTVKLTQAQYDQVHALELLGDKQGAVTLVTKIYADQTNSASTTVVKNMSEIGKAIDALKDKATTGWHTVGGFVSFLAQAQAKAFNDNSLISNLIPGVGQMNFVEAMQNLAPQGFEQAGVNATSATAGAGAAGVGSGVKLSADQIKANEALQKSWDNSGTEAEKSAAKIRDLKASLHDATDAALAAKGVFRDAAGNMSGAGWDRLVKSITDKQRQAPDPTGAIKAWEKTQLDTLKAVQDATTYAYQDQQITAESYYSTLDSLAKRQLDIEQQSIAKQIAALSGRRDSEEKIKTLRQQSVDDEQKFQNTIAQNSRDEVLAVRARQQAWEDYAKALQRGTDQLIVGFQQQARSVGMGSDEANQKNAQDSRARQYLQSIEDINEAETYNRISSAEAAKERSAQTQAFLRDQQAIVDGYGNIKAAEADWSNGAKKAWDEWKDKAENTAAATQSLVTASLDGVANSFADLVVTGKNTFGDLFNSLSKMIVEFAVKWAIMKAIMAASGDSGGSGGGSTVSAIGGTFGAIAASGAFGSAQGNAFGGGTLAGYRNSVVSQPTYFPFAKGGVPNIGLMGERAGGSSEAIMPLTRTSGGDLAVKAVQSNQRPAVVYNQNISVQGNVDRRTRQQLAQQSGRETVRALERA